LSFYIYRNHCLSPVSQPLDIIINDAANSCELSKKTNAAGAPANWTGRWRARLFIKQCWEATERRRQKQLRT